MSQTQTQTQAQAAQLSLLDLHLSFWHLQKKGILTLAHTDLAVWHTLAGLWNDAFRPTWLEIKQADVMGLAGVRSRTTYAKTLASLELNGLILREKGHSGIQMGKICFTTPLVLAALDQVYQPRQAAPADTRPNFGQENADTRPNFGHNYGKELQFKENLKYKEPAKLAVLGNRHRPLQQPEPGGIGTHRQQAAAHHHRGAG